MRLPTPPFDAQTSMSARAFDMVAGERADDLGFQFGAMASRCEVRMVGMSQEQAEPLAHEAIAEVRRIETKYSRYLAPSIVSRINALAGTGQSLAVDDETAHLLDFAASLHAASDGLFDITSGILRQAWDFRARRVPSRAAIQALLPRIGWSRVRWERPHIALPLPGMELDFGGFGKEYAADRAATLLQSRGVRHGLVNLGGDIRLVGPRLDGEPWILGIQHPRVADCMLGSMALTAGALATSGDYERYFDLDGVRYCHVLDPRSGWPVAAWRSVSVIAPACLAAGALTTVAMLKGTHAIEFLQSQDVGYLAVDARGQVHSGGAAASTLN